ncbi:MAG: alpha/beta hydrolase [Pseudomonadota bacterium]
MVHLVRQHRRRIAALILFVAAFSGCTLIHLKQEFDAIIDTTVIVGWVDVRCPADGPIIVAARAQRPGRPIAHYTVLHESGEYELVVPSGNYEVFAFVDGNQNLILDAGEAAGQFGGSSVVHTPDVGVVPDIDIVVTESGNPIAVPPGTTISPDRPLRLSSRQAGAVTDLDDPRFSEDNGAKGFWAPMAFFREFGGNIFFLEPYDPDKTPVLFIHGAGGTPRGWRYLVEHMDRTRFQPWFYYYPSGARIDSMANLLFWKLFSLQRKYHFGRIDVTAHSMGGLVARSFIVNYGPQMPVTDLFISLATPWGGDPMAEYGVRQSPVVIPSWIDMQPGSDFIKSLYRRKLPESVSFYMFYGYRGDRSPFRSNNDGTIVLNSLLDDRPQSEAKMNYAFAEDHTSLLSSPRVAVQYNAVLNAGSGPGTDARRRPEGHVRVHCAYTYDVDGVRPGQALILRPADQPDAQILTLFSADDNGGIVGPFPAGDYLADMAVSGGKTRRNGVPVTVTDGETAALEFIVVPDGEIIGCVTAPLSPEDRSIGMPDYRYRAVDRSIVIKSVALAGEGIRRRPDPVTGEEITDYDYLIARNDFCYNQCFGFFGLPAGDYSLTILAAGYRPLEKRYSVTPGTPQAFRTTELMPE